MALNISYFKAIQNATELSSAQDLAIQEAKTRLANELITSIGYKPKATRNGVLQPIVLSTGKKSYKSTIVALPDNPLFVGDMVIVGNDRWLIVEISNTNPIQTVGTAWLCNQLFKFQNGTTTIIEKYGVFDDGTYSHISDDQIVTLDSKTSFYLPYDDDTKFIFVDKRLATDVVYNKSAEPELLCWSVTAVNPKSKNYGTGSHLLELAVASSAYDSTRDNMSNMVCDYISSSGGGSTGELLPCSITTARSGIRTGTSYTYAVTFYEADGVTVDDTVVAVWTVNPAITGVTSTPNGNSIKISVASNDDLVGSTFVLSVTASNGLYNTITYNVEVV